MPRKPEIKSDLNDKQRRFIREYLVDRNATQAAIRAGYSRKTAGQIGSENLTKPEIQREIAAAEADLARRTEITAEKVLIRWWDIATADPNELVRHQVDCCRRCHGIDHQFQWRDHAEYGEAVAKAMSLAEAGKPAHLPTKEGGFGFDPHKPPHPKCPKCEGHGIGRVVVADTRKLKGPAKLLYAGVKQTRNGIEVMMLDKAKALEIVSRHIGLLNEKLSLFDKDENPILTMLKQVQGTALKPVSSPNEEDEE